MHRSGRVIAAILTLVSVAVGVSGCEAPEPSLDPMQLSDTAWQVTEYRAEAGMKEPSVLGALEGRGLTLELAGAGGQVAGGTASGTGGINAFNAPWSAGSDGAFEIGALASTSMAGPAPLIAQENAYFAALEAATAWNIVDGSLELSDTDGNLVVRYAEGVPGPGLEGVSWSCTGYNNGQEAFVSLVADSKVTTRFEGGRLSGNAGVNDFEGAYQFVEPNVTIEAASPTTAEQGPPELMDQESAYLAMLPRVRTYKIVGTVLTLYGDDELRLAIYEPEASEQ